MNTDPSIREMLRNAWDWCAVSGKPLALLVVEPDTPAAAQDTAVLEHVQRTVHVHCGRNHDHIVQPAHATFLAILPDTSPPGARHVGEQIVEAMHHIPNNGATVSVGIAATAPVIDGDCEVLLTRANSALRTAQHQGGDRCVGGSAAPLPPQGPLARFRALFPGSKKAPDHKRATD